MTLMSGSEAKAWEQKSDSEVLEGALRVLRVIFGMQISKLVKFHVTRWGRDQWSRGSYSYIRAGSSGEDIEKLAEPLAGKVFFAGEVCYVEWWKTAIWSHRFRPLDLHHSARPPTGSTRPVSMELCSVA